MQLSYIIILSISFLSFGAFSGEGAGLSLGEKLRQSRPLTFDAFIAKQSPLQDRLAHLAESYKGVLQVIKDVVDEKSNLTVQQQDKIGAAVQGYHRELQNYREQLLNAIKDRFGDDEKLHEYWNDVAESEVEAFQIGKVTFTKSGVVFAGKPDEAALHQKWTMSVDDQGKTKFSNVDPKAKGPDQKIKVEMSSNKVLKTVKGNLEKLRPKSVNTNVAIGYIKDHVSHFEQMLSKYKGTIKTTGSFILFDLALSASANAALVAPTEPTAPVMPEDHPSDMPQ